MWDADPVIFPENTHTHTVELGPFSEVVVYPDPPREIPRKQRIPTSPHNYLVFQRLINDCTNVHGS